ncbi:MAG: hypothetical protein KIT83_18780 [Bryobacterales bacterium]|nr:hypothetical protein [Bryobacterales bacterium]
MKLLLAVLLAIAPCWAGPVIAEYFDGVFSFEDWNLTAGSTSATVTNVIVEQVLAGGNPDEFHRQRMEVGQTPGGGTQIFYNRYMVNPSFVWNPGTDGAIDTMTFSVDLRLHSSAGITPILTAFYQPMIIQNGTFYLSNTTFARATTDFEWATFVFATTQATNWAGPGGSGSPDFSESGAEMQFGFRMSHSLVCNAQVGNFCGEGHSESWVDNYSLRIVGVSDTAPIPEPASVILFTSGLLVLAVWGRRQAART